MTSTPPRGRILLACIAMVPSIAGCWSFQIGPGDPELPSTLARPATSSAILRVSDAGIPWSNGELGPAIQEALLAQGVFREVHYPTEPVDPPSLVVEIVGLGGLDEAVLWGLIAAGATGYFLLLPALVLPFFQDYEAALEVRVLRGGEVVGTFDAEAEANIVHAIFAGPHGYVPKARKSLIGNLAGRVAAGVTRVAYE